MNSFSGSCNAQLDISIQFSCVCGFSYTVAFKNSQNNNPVVLDQVIEGPQLSRSNVIARRLTLY